MHHVFHSCAHPVKTLLPPTVHSRKVMAAWRASISKHVRELRFLISASEESSAAARSYIRHNYDELKMLNPTTPFLVRDGWPGKDPYVVATYDWGKEVIKTMGGLDEKGIDALLKGLVEDGKSLPKYTHPPLRGTPDAIVDALPRDVFY
ncbi:nadh dehydrogenase [Nannochloropsis gaditana]|uniref:Nadh dehydrogenase n=2 Tax=Nannochloropsis gaditana TaxID=72520 RepID=W7TWI6_9STRA|nr:nadh dehydrogenase [Nannochloropsis gaditana]